MDKKYICYGGEVVSRSDGDRHYITARKVAVLYGVGNPECIFIDGGYDEYRLRGYQTEALQKLIPLRPRDDGNYMLAKPAPRGNKDSV